MRHRLSYQVIGLFLIFLGEFLSIYGEMIGSKSGRNNSLLLIKPMLFMILGGLSLLSGYVIAYSGFKNIRIVSVISITAILIFEPLLARGLFHELPTRGSIIGFLCGMIGMIATILF